MLQKVQEAVTTSQTWIFLSRGEPKDTPDPPWMLPQDAVAASQDLPPSECPRICVVQQRSHMQRTGKMETLPFRSVPGSTSNKKCLSHQPMQEELHAQ